MTRNLKYMSMVLAGLLAVACSGNGDEPEVKEDPTPISFQSGIASETDITTRASERGLEDYTNTFVVTGYKLNATDGWQDVMTNYNVNYLANTSHSTVTNTHDWEYVGQQSEGAEIEQEVKYWDFASQYCFVGYVPVRKGKGTPAKLTIGTDEFLEYDYEPTLVVNKDASGNPTTFRIAMNLHYITEKGGQLYLGDCNATDKVLLSEKQMPLLSKLWYGYAQKDQPVTLEFFKPYAKVRVMLMRASDVPNAPVTDIKFGPKDDNDKLSETGTTTYTYTLGTPAMAHATEYGTNTLKDNVFVFDDFKDEETGKLVNPNVSYQIVPSYLMLPCNHGDFEMTVTYGSGSQTCIVPAKYMQWEPGYQYTYIFKLTESGINYISLLKVGMREWGKGESGDHNLHNW